MAFTDQELMMIEQLTYLSKEVAKAASSDGHKVTRPGITENDRGKTIGEILSAFDEQALEQLRENAKLPDKDKRKLSESAMNGEEWAAMIEYMQNNEDISNLVLTDTLQDGKKSLALCFSDGEGSSDAIVAFKGTADSKEWADNAYGLNESDTECQEQAYEFIEGLDYDNITVTGHSKGANKAMYVTVRSDKVSRCVAMDGQGFSQEFIDKYSYEIGERAGLIKNYSVSTDFVHVLLYQIPGSQQIYCEGYGIDSPAENHAPNSFFEIDENGHIACDANGNPKVHSGIPEDPAMTKLHEFTNFILNNASDSDKEKLADYLGPLLALIFRDPQPSVQEIVEYIMAHEDGSALTLAYLIRYMETYNLDGSYIVEVLEALGVDNKIIQALAYILTNYIKIQQTDGKSDYITVAVIKALINKLLGVDYDYSGIWRKTEEKINKIDTSGGKGDYQSSGHVITGIADFSVNLQSLYSACEDLDGIYNSLSAAEEGIETARKTVKGLISYLILSYKLIQIRKKISQEKRKVKCMRTALYRCSNIYENTEKKNLAAI